MRSIGRSLIGLALAASSLWPATAAAQKASYDFRQQADFSRPRTFAFKVVPAVRPDVQKTATYDSPFIDEHTNVAIAATGGTVAVVVSVAPDGRNRLLTIQAGSGTYLRSSAVQLDGDNEAVTQQFWFKGLPDGEYLISGRLEGAEGSVLATASTQLRVGSDYVRR